MYKKYFEKKKAAIFDLDGTIVPTEIISEFAIEQVIKSTGLPFYDYDEVRGGVDMKNKWEIILRLSLPSDLKGIEKYVDATHTKMLEVLEKYPLEPRTGFHSFYDTLKDRGYKIGLATNSNKVFAQAVMQKIGIENYFDAVLFRENVKKPKPNAEIYKKMLKELRVSAKDTIVFEDAVIGSKSAASAHIQMFIMYNDEEVINRNAYSGDIGDFLPDFTFFRNNMDKNLEDFLREKAQQYIKEG